MQKVLASYHVELVRDGGQRYECQSSGLNSPQHVVNALRQVTGVDASTQERFYALLLDTKNRLIALHELYRGTVNACLVSPRDIVQVALLHNASGLILAHNHPSGEPTPSAEDIRVTKDIQAACEIMDVSLLDHIVIGEDGHYCSLREKGLYRA